MGHALMKHKRLHLCAFSSLKFEILIKFTPFTGISFFHETINEALGKHLSMQVYKICSNKVTK